VAMPDRRFAAMLPVLSAHGLVPGPAGFDPRDLVAFAARRGWTAAAERTGVRPGSRSSRRWRASVFAPAPRGTAAGVGVSGTNGTGPTEGEALAVALASLLARHAG
jgi:hypothetical protein